MIKFFRHIRKSLLMENKNSKYFKYAIGEIVLVVIGILIALQINNWNEERKTKIKEQNLIIALKHEFQLNLEKITLTIENNSNNIKGAEEFASILSPVETNLTDAEIGKIWDKTFRREAIFRPSLGVLNEAINSGNLSIIKNNELRNLLASLDADIQQLQQQEKTVFDFRIQCYNSLRNIGSFRKILDNLKDTEGWYKLSPSKFKNSNKKLLQSETFENDLVLFIGTSMYLGKNFLVPLKEKLIYCLDILNSEIIYD